MSIEEENVLTKLYFTYGKMLSPIQNELFNLYYLFNLSLSEISELKNISRQGVSDSLNKSKKLLYELEEAIGFSKAKSEINQLIGGLGDENQQIINQIKQIVEN